ncbi:hypothetical protein TNCV_4505401 [Trichonephila clavipes]|nr:hypothetical protein TNCV_4505401 [Trichonephila clavipes]
MCTALTHNHGRKILTCIGVSEKKGKMSKTTNSLNIRRLPAQQETSKGFCGSTCRRVMSETNRASLNKIEFLHQSLSQFGGYDPRFVTEWARG